MFQLNLFNHIFVNISRQGVHFLFFLIFRYNAYVILIQYYIASTVFFNLEFPYETILGAKCTN